MKVIMTFLIGMNLYASEGGMKGKEAMKTEAFAAKKKMALERVEKRLQALTESKTCIAGAVDSNALQECRKKSRMDRKEMKSENKEEHKKFKEMRKAKRAEWKEKRKKMKAEMKESAE